MASFLSNPLVVSIIGALICTVILIFTVFKRDKYEEQTSYPLKKVLLTFGFIFITILGVKYLTSDNGGKLSGGGFSGVIKGSSSGGRDLPILTDSFDS